MKADTMAGKNTDVVDLIIEDHRRFEELFRTMRNVDADRGAALQEFADLLIAHGLAEEGEVYPALKRFKKVDDDEVEHGEEEHLEGNKALADLLEVSTVGSDEWDEKLEELVEKVNHHINEEEQTILNSARTEVPDERRAELGKAFTDKRKQELASKPGNLENVRKVIAAEEEKVG
jgi:hemerythrin-like domain-containing protein